MVGEKRFWEILSEYPNILRVEELGYKYDEELGEYLHSSGAGRFYFSNEKELRSLLDDWIIDEAEPAFDNDNEIDEFLAQQERERLEEEEREFDEEEDQY